MLRTGRVEVESEAGVGPRRAVLRRAWFHRRLDSSIATEADRWPVECPASFVPVEMRQTGTRVAGHSNTSHYLAFTPTVNFEEYKEWLKTITPFGSEISAPSPRQGSRTRPRFFSRTIDG